MIRTRDFILYMTTLIFVVLGTTYTGLLSHPSPNSQATPVEADKEAVVARAFLPTRTTDLNTRLAELRIRLMDGEGYLAKAPAVFTSVDQVMIEPPVPITTTENINETTRQQQRSVQWCDHAPPPVDLSRWPSAVVQITDTERVLRSEVTSAVVVGTTTKFVRQAITRVALPIRTVRSTFTSCLDSLLIGVTVNGSPLRNDSVYRYLKTSAQTPIGYTRDGFTVFGAVSDEAALDECGGQYVQNKYQYHLRPGEPFIIGCYAGLPVPLNL